MTEPLPVTPEILNVASILRTYCGRSPEGVYQDCGHDHVGDARGLIEQISRQSEPGVLRAAVADGDTTGAKLKERADRLQSEFETALADIPAR